jgi:hypothetical protein
MINNIFPEKKMIQISNTILKISKIRIIWKNLGGFVFSNSNLSSQLGSAHFFLTCNFGGQINETASKIGSHFKLDNEITN